MTRCRAQARATVASVTGWRGRGSSSSTTWSGTSGRPRIWRIVVNFVIKQPIVGLLHSSKSHIVRIYLILTFITRSNYYLSTSNCYLSELAVTNVQNQDLLQDSEWTLYESLDGQYCGDQGGAGGQGGENDR